MTKYAKSYLHLLDGCPDPDITKDIENIAALGMVKSIETYQSSSGYGESYRISFTDGYSILCEADGWSEDKSEEGTIIKGTIILPRLR